MELAIGHLAAVRLFLDKGADISIPDEQEETALHLTVSGGHEAVVQLPLRGELISQFIAARRSLNPFLIYNYRCVIHSST